PKDVFYGLGYDSVNDDYKVVRMVQSTVDRSKERFRFPLEIKVFSLKRNSWKEIYVRSQNQNLFVNFYYSLLYRRGNGVLANNFLHWLLPLTEGYNVAFNTVIRFDLASEELGVLCIPMDLILEDHIDIGVLDGSMCLMRYKEFNHVDIWIMREYQVAAEVWPKLCRVPKPDGVESFKLLRPLLYSKDKTKILLEINNAKNLMWFDLESKRFTRVGIKDCDSSYSTEIVVSSLVLGCNGDLPKKE
ncbi:hypothetical protein AALP_AAs55953U000100, partial [Arabis alpina]